MVRNLISERNIKESRIEEKRSLKGKIHRHRKGNTLDKPRTVIIGTQDGGKRLKVEVGKVF